MTEKNKDNSTCFLCDKSSSEKVTTCKNCHKFAHDRCVKENDCEDYRNFYTCDMCKTVQCDKCSDDWENACEWFFCDSCDKLQCEKCSLWDSNFQQRICSKCFRNGDEEDGEDSDDQESQQAENGKVKNENE